MTRKIFNRAAADLFVLVDFPVDYSLFFISFFAFFYSCFVCLFVCLFFELKNAYSDTHSTMSDKFFTWPIAGNKTAFFFFFYGNLRKQKLHRTNQDCDFLRVGCSTRPNAVSNLELIGYI